MVQVFVAGTSDANLRSSRGSPRTGQRAGTRSSWRIRGARKALNNATLRLARAGQKPTCHNFFTVMHRRHYRGALCPHYAVLCYYLRYRGCLFICLASPAVLDLPLDLPLFPPARAPLLPCLFSLSFSLEGIIAVAPLKTYT